METLLSCIKNFILFERIKFEKNFVKKLIYVIFLNFNLKKSNL